MSDERLFERDARAWLELGPQTAPRRPVDAALAIIDTTPQERALRIPWRFPQMTSRTRFVLAAAVGVIALVAAGAVLVQRPQVQVGTPSPTPTHLGSPSPSPLSLQSLQGAWASVGGRDDPVGVPVNPPQFEAMVVDAAGLRINSFKGDVTSSASTVAGGQVTLLMTAAQNMLARQNWACTTGDTGLYDASLSLDQQTLTLTSAGDQCTTRSDILTGDWTRWSCPQRDDGYSYCDHVSELAPGRYVAPLFRPFGGGNSGELAYTVAAGWAKLSQPPTWPGPGDSADLWFSRVDEPDRQAISVFSNIRPSNAVAVLEKAASGACSGGTVSPSGTAAQVADFLTSLPYLAVSGRTPVRIGGLSGVQIDVSLVAGFVDPCSTSQIGNGPIEYSKSIAIFDGNPDGAGLVSLGSPNSSPFDISARFILLDTGPGVELIEVSASGPAALSGRVDQAMPLINSFEFIR